MIVSKATAWTALRRKSGNIGGWLFQVGNVMQFAFGFVGSGWHATVSGLVFVLAAGTYSSSWGRRSELGYATGAGLSALGMVFAVLPDLMAPSWAALGNLLGFACDAVGWTIGIAGALLARGGFENGFTRSSRGVMGLFCMAALLPLFAGAVAHGEVLWGTVVAVWGVASMFMGISVNDEEAENVVRVSDMA